MRLRAIAKIYVSARSAAFSFVRRAVGIACAALPDRLAVAVHAATDRVRSMDYPDDRILLHVQSDVELRVRLHSLAKEPEMLPWLRKALRPGDVLYDVGANVGAYSLLAAALHRGAVDVVAIEPSATTYAQLCRNIALNPLASRITPLPVALTQQCSLTSFGYSDLTAGAALHSVGIPMKGNAYVQQVIGMPLDYLIAMYRLPLPNAIKVDVDGAEVGVIRGASATLSSPQLRSVLIELEEGSDSFGEITDLLNKAGLFIVKKHHLDGAFHNFDFERRHPTHPARRS
jgi:FkbM family methyltransferase